MVAGATGIGRGRLETQSGDIQSFNETTAPPNDTALLDIIVNPLRKQRGLVAILTLYEAAHTTILSWKVVSYLLPSFHTASASFCLSRITNERQVHTHSSHPHDLHAAMLVNHLLSCKINPSTELNSEYYLLISIIPQLSGSI